MQYKDLLNKLIDRSGLSNKEILERCKRLGISITPNYLSVLKNQKDKIPSEDISRAIANVCGAENEEILIVQGYLDKAPAIIISALESIKKTVGNSANLAFSMNPLLEQMPEAQKEQLINQLVEEFKNMSLSEFIMEIDKNDVVDYSEISYDQITAKKQWILVPIGNKEDIRILKNEDVAQIKGEQAFANID